MVAEDDEDTVLFMRRAFKKSGIDDGFQAVSDGVEAVAYLSGEGQYADRHKFPFPTVLLCDLKMPRMDGYELLRWLGEHESCKVVPTVIFSSSRLESDVHQCYVMGANAFLEKPTSPDEMAEVLKAMYEFWCRCEVPVPPPDERCQ